MYQGVGLGKEKRERDSTILERCDCWDSIKAQKLNHEALQSEFPLTFFLLQKSIPPHRNLIRFECANVTTSNEKKNEDLMEANIVMEYADGTYSSPLHSLHLYLSYA